MKREQTRSEARGETVWDASALLVLLQREPGWRSLGERLARGAMSAVNLSEVAAKLSDAGGASEAVREVLGGLPLKIVDFTADQAHRAAALRRETRRLGLSLGDRACLALGQSLAVPVITADRSWLELDLGTPIELVRPRG